VGKIDRCAGNAFGQLVDTLDRRLDGREGER
jgi:hypothetical protein